MICKVVASVAVMLSLISGSVGTALAQPTGSSDAPKPAADTKEPGKTATDAVTNPTVPPSEEPVGGRKAPQAGSAVTDLPSGPKSAR